jgi:hypothetical protein
MLGRFRGREVNVGLQFDRPGPGSLGEWIKKNLPTKMNPATYVAGLLIDEGYAERSGRGTIQFYEKRKPNVREAANVSRQWWLGEIPVDTRVSSWSGGLLILDEPQQQSVEEGSYLAMLEYASRVKKSQIIMQPAMSAHPLVRSLKRINGRNLFEYGDDRVLDRLWSLFSRGGHDRREVLAYEAFPSSWYS